MRQERDVDLSKDEGDYAGGHVGEDACACQSCGGVLEVVSGRIKDGRWKMEGRRTGIDEVAGDAGGVVTTVKG